MKKKKKTVLFISTFLTFSILLNSVHAFSFENYQKVKSMEQIVKENLVKTQKVVVKDSDTEEVKYEKVLSESTKFPKLRTMSTDSEDITLASGESATYYDEYTNIQGLKNAIIDNYPEKDDEEVAKDILRALDQDDDVINSVTSNEIDTILEYESAMGASNYYSVYETTDELQTENIVKNDRNMSEISTYSLEDSTGFESGDEDLRTYTWVAYYGKDSLGESQFNSYATVRWNNEDTKNRYTDIIAIMAANDSSVVDGVENSILDRGAAGYLSRDYTCKNYKFENTPCSEDRGRYYSTLTGNVKKNALFENKKVTYRDDKLINIHQFLNIIAFECPYINFQCEERVGNPLYHIEHRPSFSNTKYYVSAYYINNQTTNFQGIYYHTKKQYKTSTSVGLGSGINIDTDGVSIGISSSISKNFETEYIKNTFTTPCIVARFNGSDFVKFS